MIKYGSNDSETDSDGRCTNLLPPKGSPDAKELAAGGLYKITFRTKDYFSRTNRNCFYPWVEVRIRFHHWDL
jgi:5-hydroxyisourate hydrolase